MKSIINLLVLFTMLRECPGVFPGFRNAEENELNAPTSVLRLLNWCRLELGKLSLPYSNLHSDLT